MNRVVHFEIHAEDPERAAKFYSSVFGWDIKKFDSPEMEYWLVMTGDKGSTVQGKEGHGIDGGLLRRTGAAPADGAPVNAFVCTMQVDNIDETIKKAIAAGATLTTPKFALTGMAWQAYCKDTEGNLFGVHQADPNAK